MLFLLSTLESVKEVRTESGFMFLFSADFMLLRIREIALERDDRIYVINSSIHMKNISIINN